MPPAGRWPGKGGGWCIWPPGSLRWGGPAADRRHRRERDGWGFETLEEPYDLEKAAAALRGDEVVLLDSLTALLGNRMFGPRPQESPVADLDRGLEVLCRRAEGVVAVTDDLFSDAALYEGLPFGIVSC